jgi:hypothetical protein
VAETFFLEIIAGWLTACVAPWLAISAGICLAILFIATGMGSSLNNQVQHHVFQFLALDILLAAWLWMRLARLTPKAQPVPADERLPWLSHLLAGRGQMPAGGMVNAGLWRRVRHRRQIGLGHRFVWILAVYLALLIAITPWFRPHSYQDYQDAIAFTSLLLAGVTSALAVGLSWPRRYADLCDIELLRPASRSDFGREIALAMLCDAAELIGATVLAMLAPVAIWSPFNFQSIQFWNAVAATILSQVLVFGVILWVMRRKSTAATMAGLAAGILATILLIDQGLDRRGVMPALVAAGIGLVLIADAYRRWRKADIL